MHLVANTDEICVQYFYLTVVGTTVAYDGDGRALLDALGCCEFLELLLLTALLREQAIDVDGARLVLKIEVAVDVTILESLDLAGELIPDIIAIYTFREGRSDSIPRLL